MASDAIKDALEAAYPDTTASEWKRRSKKSETGYITRDFEHSVHGRVSTYETSDGNITIGNPPSAAAIAAIAAPAPASAPVSTPTSVVAPPATTRVPLAAQAAVPSSLAELVKLDLPTIEHSFSEGDRISIPAGVEAFGLNYWGAPSSKIVMARATTAKIIKILPAAPKEWLLLADDEYLDAILKALPDLRKDDLHYLIGWMTDRGGLGSARYTNNTNLLQAIANAKANVIEKFKAGYAMVAWGKDDTKGALVTNVQLAKTQEVKAAKPKGLTKRNQMVVDSIWEFDRDCDLNIWITNPERLKIKARYPKGGWGRDANWDKVPAQIKVKAATIPAGTQIKIEGKPETTYFNTGEETNGLMFPVTFPNGHAIQFHANLGSGYDNPLNPNYSRSATMALPYKAIADFISAKEIPVDLVYVLRDTKTGMFFGGWETEAHNYYKEALHASMRGTNQPKMVERFSSAKKYKTSSAVKASIRDFTGYSSGLDTHESDQPYWTEGGEKKIDLPETWEMVAVDKATGNEHQIIDVQDWYKGLMRLRVLTEKHGSAARAVFKKAEGKGYDSIIVIKNFDRGQDYKGNPYSYQTSFDDDDRADEKLAIIKKASADMGGHLREKTSSAVAYACGRTDAVLMKMMIGDPELEVTILDMATLEEVVEEAQA